MGKLLKFVARFRVLQPVFKFLVEKFLLPKIQRQAEAEAKAAQFADVPPIMRRPRREGK